MASNDVLFPVGRPVRRDHAPPPSRGHARRQPGLRLAPPTPRPRPREGAQPEIPGPSSPAISGIDQRKGGDRNGHVGDRPDVCADEAAGADADDRRGHPVHDTVRPGITGSRANSPFPISVARDRDQRCARLVVVTGQQAPDNRRQPERVVIPSRSRSWSGTRFVDPGAPARNVNPPLKSADAAEDLPFTVPSPRTIAYEKLPRALPPRSGLEADLHERLRLGDRERPQHQRVDETEDGGVGADAEREGHDCGRRERLVSGGTVRSA